MRNDNAACAWIGVGGGWLSAIELLMELTLPVSMQVIRRLHMLPTHTEWELHLYDLLSVLPLVLA